jgi:hypothetical protein
LLQNKKYFILKLRNITLVNKLNVLFNEFRLNFQEHQSKSMNIKLDLGNIYSTKREQKKSIFNNFDENILSLAKKKIVKKKSSNVVREAAKNNFNDFQILLDSINIYSMSGLSFTNIPDKSRKSSLKLNKKKHLGSYLKKKDYHWYFVFFILKCVRKIKFEFDILRNDYVKQSVSSKECETILQKKLNEIVVVIDKYLFFQKFLGKQSPMI